MTKDTYVDDMDTPELPANLAFLRRLVTVLTLIMIGGVVTVVSLLVIRLNAPGVPPLPDRIDLPDGARAQAFTQGADWFAVVTDANEILIFDRDDGTLRQTVTIDNK